VGHNKHERKMLRGANSGELRDLFSAVFRSGIRYRTARSGIIVYGPPGTKPVTLHLTLSDHRALKNAARDLRVIGIEVKGKK
jgi:hypothetical protein